MAYQAEADQKLYATWPAIKQMVSLKKEVCGLQPASDMLDMDVP